MRVLGYVRLFNKVSPAWMRKHGEGDDVAIASCAARARSGATFLGTAFSMEEADFPALFEREHHYRWVEVQAEELDGRGTRGRMCVEWTDEDYRLNRCVTDAEYEHRVGRYYQGRLWRDDVLPCPPYLEACLEAARSHGEAVYEDFVRTSYLADGRTTIEAYLAERAR